MDLNEEEVTFEEFFDEVKIAVKFELEIEPYGLVLTLPGENGTGPKKIRSPNPQEVTEERWEGFCNALNYILNLRGWTP